MSKNGHCAHLVTVLTDAPLHPLKQIAQGLRGPRHFADFLRRVASGGKRRSIGGHTAVTRSALDGLQQLNFAFNYNPAPNQIAPICVVLSGLEALRWAIKAKKQQKIMRLVAGPNILTTPDEHSAIIADSSVDICLVPSEWVGSLYEHIAPSLVGRTKTWAAGVDTAYWSPRCGEKRRTSKKRALIFLKGNARGALPEHARRSLAGKGYETATITYGEFDQAHYRSMLEWADVMVVFGTTESQGIALAEAWSMDIPTYVLAADSWQAADGRVFAASSAPYLSPKTGRFFRTLEDLESLLRDFQNDLAPCAPRSWILQNMSDPICARHLLDAILGKELQRPTGSVEHRQTAFGAI